MNMGTVVAFNCTSGGYASRLLAFGLPSIGTAVRDVCVVRHSLQARLSRPHVYCASTLSVKSLGGCATKGFCYLLPCHPLQGCASNGNLVKRIVSSI